jgi:hypothetical protein
MWVRAGKQFQKTSQRTIQNCFVKTINQFCRRMFVGLVGIIYHPPATKYHMPVPMRLLKGTMQDLSRFLCLDEHRLKSNSRAPAAFEKVYESFIRKGRVEDGMSEQMADFDHKEVSTCLDHEKLCISLFGRKEEMEPVLLTTASQFLVATRG